MSLFPRTLYDSDGSSSFTPLFRLLDEFDNYSRQGGASSLVHDSHPGSAFWQPKFDVGESGDQYELHGEFPGMRKEDIYIEFPQPQTLVIRGKSERTYSGTEPSSSADRVEDVSNKPTITEAGDDQKGDTVAQASPKAIEKTEQPKYWLRERKVGEFSRSFIFPSPVDQDAISAGFKDGVLSVSVPKAKKPQPRRIAIN
ncbi:heat shock protein 30 [Cordyceps fumosorosea ARSEF 2679]|uniref:Heat shock protein 30 n=1 Tax=Cordyceps fumosorosea (strain ARSEF 2679) TaxID=1081104 RepID=A0A167TKY0_CORFA|nr:heat shock protein 30 [Cordyceps fumosorosea ARSEF 2679]OAA60707.1 heat shock protein 30 [Cordyceps fumosorosea ARSEF 2679]